MCARGRYPEHSGYPQYYSYPENNSYPENCAPCTSRMSWRVFIYVNILFVLLQGCSERVSNDQLPRNAPDKAVLQNDKVSTLETRVLISKNRLQELAADIPRRTDINENFDIAHGKICPCIGGKKLGSWSIGGHADGAITLPSNPQVTLNQRQNRIEMTAPVTVEVSVHTRGAIKVGGTIRGSLTLLVSALPVINNDWTVNPNVSVTHQWITNPYFEVGNHITGKHKISIKSIADKKIEKLQEDFAKRMNRSTASHIDIRPDILKFWKQCHMVRRINSANYWLTVTPTAIKSDVPTVQSGEVALDVGVDAKMVAYIGQDPGKLAIATLPPPTLSKTITPHFRFSFPVIVTYEELSDRVARKVVGKPWSYQYSKHKSVKITPTKLKIYPSGGSLAVYVEFDADVSGKWMKSKVALTLIGEPVFDNENKTLRLENCRLSVDSDNDLVTTADWLLHDVFVQRLQAAMKTDLSKKYNSEIDRANKEITNTKLEGATLHGALKGIGFGSIAILDQSLLIPVTMNGKIMVSMP